MEHMISRLIEVDIKEPEQIMRVCALILAATMDTRLVEEANSFMNMSPNNQIKTVKRVLRDFE